MEVFSVLCVRVLKCVCVCESTEACRCVACPIDRYYLNSSVGWLWRAHSL